VTNQWLTGSVGSCMLRRVLLSSTARKFRGEQMVTESQVFSAGELQANVASLSHVLSRGPVANGASASISGALTGTLFDGFRALPFTTWAGSFLMSCTSTSIINHSDRTTAAAVVNAISVITKGAIACDLTWQHAQCRSVISLV